MSRFACVDDQKAAGFPVTTACEAAGVSTSGFYDWCAREAAGPTERQVAEAELVELMREIFDASDGNYGVPRMYEELRRAGLVDQREAGAAADAPARHGRTVPSPQVPHHVPRPRRLRRSPISSAGASTRARPTWRGARTSPTSRPAKAGCTWRRCSISGRAGCSATRWPSTCAPSSSLDALGMAVAARGGDVAGVIAPRRSRVAVHVERLPRLLPDPSAATLGRRTGDVLGQRGRRVVLGIAQARMHPRTGCSPPAPRPAGRSSGGSTGTTPSRLHTSLDDIPPIEWEQQYRQAS